MNVFKNHWTLPQNDYVPNNPLSLFWKDSSARKNFIENHPERLVGSYLIGMGAYVATVVVRIAKVVQAFFSVCWLFTPTPYKLPRLQLSVLQLSSAFIGVLCPPLAYRIDEWLHGITFEREKIDSDSPIEIGQIVVVMNPMIWVRDKSPVVGGTQHSNPQESQPQKVQQHKLELHEAGWTLQSNEGDSRKYLPGNPNSSYWKRSFPSKWVALAIYGAGMIGYAGSLVWRIGVAGYQLARNIRFNPPQDVKLTQSIIGVASAILGLICPPIAYRVDEWCYQDHKENLNTEFVNSQSLTNEEGTSVDPSQSDNGSDLDHVDGDNKTAAEPPNKSADTNISNGNFNDLSNGTHNNAEGSSSNKNERRSYCNVM